MTREEAQVLTKTFGFHAVSVAAQRWILMADGVSLDRPHTHGTKSSEWFITRWRLNDTASSLRLILQSDNFWLCNVTLHAYPGELELGIIFKQKLTHSFSFR
jgi:hypothetical protein